MSDLSLSGASRTWRRPPLIANPLLRWGLVLGAAVYLTVAFGTTEVNWTRVWEGLPRGKKFLLAFAPPDFVSRWEEIVDGVLESLWMTAVSTVIGIALSVPIALGAARNIAPLPIYYFCRAIIAVSRSFQEVILAIFFVKLFGFGPFAGVVTLSIATIGFFAKLLAEDIEDMDANQAEAVRATGARWFQWLNYGFSHRSCRALSACRCIGSTSIFVNRRSWESSAAAASAPRSTLPSIGMNSIPRRRSSS